MDIMNSMTVSSSKLTFSLIAVAALLVGGTGLFSEDSFALEPTFTAVHNSTTTTEVTFNTAVNGTLVLADWRVNGVQVTAITNGTAYTGAASHYGGSAVGVINGTTLLQSGSIWLPGDNVIMLTHASLDTSGTGVANENGTDASTNVRYIPGNISDANTYSPGLAAFKMDAQTVRAFDHILPVAKSANTMGPTLIQVHMSEKITNINATGGMFNVVGLDQAITSIVAVNGTVDPSTGIANGSNIINLYTANPITNINHNLTLTYTDNSTGGLGLTFMTDSTNSSEIYGSNSSINSDNLRGFAANQFTLATSGHGNILDSFSGLIITNYINALTEETCYDCTAPQINTVQVRTGSTNPVEATDSNPVNLVAEVGDRISFNIGFTDNRGAGTIPYTGIYTNFVDSADFDNLYYMNNFDSFNKMSTTYYEWNVRNDDVAYDLTNTATWDETLTKIERSGSSEVLFVEYTMTATDAIPSSQVWIEVADHSGNYIKIQLPVTLEVIGDEALTFGSDGQQKVLGFFNESVLSTIVSNWTDSSDSSELSSALGIPDESLPTWTSDLATWVVDDSINAADMIVAIEYLIN